MKRFATSLIATCVVWSTSQPGFAADEFTGNFGATSNYIWRGVTQTGDEAAIQGGIDYSATSNLYAGVWTSSLGGDGFELDLYGGFRGQLGDVSYDAGLIFYQYPVEGSGNDFTEVYGKFDFNLFSAQAALTIDKDNTSQDNDLYLSIGTDIEMRNQLYLSLLFGLYEFDAPGAEDYKHFHVGLKKGEFEFALDKNDKDRPLASDPDEMRLSVSWKRNFEL